jgi:hypothetical protein
MPSDERLRLAQLPGGLVLSLARSPRQLLLRRRLKPRQQLIPLRRRYEAAMEQAAEDGAGLPPHLQVRVGEQPEHQVHNAASLTRQGDEGGKVGEDSHLDRAANR